MAYQAAPYTPVRTYPTLSSSASSSLGYAGFSVTLWMFSMINAAWFDASQETLVMLLAVTIGGIAMALAGLLSFFRGRTHNMCLFLAFAAFWWSWALMVHTVNNGGIAPSSAFLGWYFLVFAVVAFALWLSAFRTGTGRMAFDLLLWLTLLALAINGWSGVGWWRIVGGYLGLITAVVGFYLLAAAAVNATFRRSVLPTGEACMVESAPEGTEHRSGL
ncbi:MAG TPA: acetate uptake transporter [Rhodanobacteraceae bacterium]|jgi:succinate-acetate transporter protein|nr:acetate uptake transporter [Rhodanobacteraceae bacterium]